MKVDILHTHDLVHTCISECKFQKQNGREGPCYVLPKTAELLGHSAEKLDPASRPPMSRGGLDLHL